MESILVVMAMEAEAAPFLDRIGAVPIDLSSTLPTRAFAAETAEDLVELGASGAIAVDMESAAVASVCELFGVRAVTPSGPVREPTAGIVADLDVTADAWPRPRRWRCWCVA